MPRLDVPRIESLKVKNYRALKDFELKNLTPLTAFLGPNGSGKSTIFDVFAFLSECFSIGLRKAWDKRNRFRELRTRGSKGPIEIEIKYRETPKAPIVTYHLSIDEEKENLNPVVSEEWLQWRRTGKVGQPYKFLDFKYGKGKVVTGEAPEKEDERIEEQLESPELIAVSTLGQFSKNPRISALRKFITSWYLSYLTADNTRNITESGPQEKLSNSGDNLPNVIQYLKEQHPEKLIKILEILSSRIPQLEKVDAELMPDGRLLLQIKDAPFDKPILAKFASDGTLKMLAYLIVLYDPELSQLIGIEEPENHLHPRLLPELAEECRKVASGTQIFVTTHSPFFINSLKAEEVWIVYRDSEGYTQTIKASEIKEVNDLLKSGAQLGELWMEGFFPAGDPLTRWGQLGSHFTKDN